MARTVITPTVTSPTVSKPTVMSLTVITQTAISPAASGSDDKIDKWHMHMTRTDGSRGSGSYEKIDIGSGSEVVAHR